LHSDSFQERGRATSGDGQIAAEGANRRSTLVAMERTERFQPFAGVLSLTGQPALSIPAGFASDGLLLST